MKKTPPFSFEDNPEISMAEAFIRQTGTHVFLTGKAGTGKTSFLTRLQADCHKQMVVTAPTGVAAINAGGVTLHSFFQLPFGPHIPGQSDRNRDYRRFFRFSKEKKRIIKGLDLLVIDEISMVRADLLDSVDAVLRRLRRDDRPFGGVQLLLIGDLFQLPPVAKPDEWQLLRNHYRSVYFFDSQALSRTDLVTIELKKIYRQSDPQFIDLLNAVRENRLDQASTALLDRCAARPVPEKGSITLTTHNRKADDINRERLNRLDESPQELTAEVDGDFPEQSFPTPARLVLKKGAQVMFLRNDDSPDRLFFNGKIGRVSRVYPDRVLVTDPDGHSEAVEVKPVDWENITYTVNEESQTIQEEIIGRFSQIPLKLAWAVTIHKSQGLTFDRAVVDAQDAFAHGQTYVALSRCRSLEGLVLSSPLPRNGCGADPVIQDFMTAADVSSSDLKARFQGARLAYQQDLLQQCYDFSAMRGMFYYFMRLADTSRGSVEVNGLSDIAGMKTAARSQIFEVGEKFLNQLRGLMTEQTLPDDDETILERTRKAAAWFEEKYTDLFSELLEKGQIETDNKALKKQMTNALDNLSLEIRVRLAGIRSCAEGFSSRRYLRRISSAGMTAPPKHKKKAAKALEYSELDMAHPDMFKALKVWRDGVAEALGIPRFQILHQKVLIQIAVCLPEDETALGNLKGVGPKTVEKYGKAILDLVGEYRDKHQIKTVSLPDPKPGKTPLSKKKKPPGTGTWQVSLDLFRQGMDTQAIADERGLTLATIQNHLCQCIEKGLLAVDRLVAPEKRRAIEKALAPDRLLRDIKDELGSEVGYAEIKAVISHRKNKTSDPDIPPPEADRPPDSR